MSGNIFNKLIDFRTGSQTEYDSILNTVGGISEEDLYYITREVEYEDTTVEQNNLYIGQNLIGDAYNSQYISNLSKRVTNPIGLIPYGMTLGKLLTETGGSLSKVVDMMLFTGRAPHVDECAIIAGFIPKVDVNDTWTVPSTIENWISEYAEREFTPEKYEMFFDLEGSISTTFTVVLDQSKPGEEYGDNAGIYTGRMFVAVPHDSERQSKDITTIVDRVFSRIYTGDGLTANFIQWSDATLEFDDASYGYKIYLFGVNQNVISQLDMEYAVDLS